MNLHALPPGAPGGGGFASLDALGPVETHALRLLRMWSWSDVHRETIRLAAPIQFGAAHGVCVVRAFEGLFEALEVAARPKLTTNPPDTSWLTPDEIWFARLAGATTHAPGAALACVAERIGPEECAAVAEKAEGLTGLLELCLKARGKAGAAACPIGRPSACPLQPQPERAEKPHLVLVK